MLFQFLHKAIGGKTELGFYIWLVVLIGHLLGWWGPDFTWDHFQKISAYLGSFTVASGLSRAEEIHELGPAAKPWFGPLRQGLGKLARLVLNR